MKPSEAFKFARPLPTIEIHQMLQLLQYYSTFFMRTFWRFSQSYVWKIAALNFHFYREYHSQDIIFIFCLKLYFNKLSQDFSFNKLDRFLPILSYFGRHYKLHLWLIVQEGKNQSKSLYNHGRQLSWRQIGNFDLLFLSFNSSV